MEKFDHIILGTGQATGTLLGKLIPTGASIAVIEAGRVGGTCVNYGCTPTKTLVASAKAIHQARRGDFFGFQADPQVNFQKVMDRMNDIRNVATTGFTDWLESVSNITLIKGHGKFTEPKSLDIDGRTISGEHIYINVGTRSFSPPIPGLADVPWLNNERLLDLKELPEDLVVLGGGYIGVEFAQVFRRLGSSVTIIQNGNQLMPNEDKDVADSVQEVLENEGIKILLCGLAEKVSVENGVTVTVKKDVGLTEENGSHRLVAIGRQSNSDTLDLAQAGIETYGRGFIKVDDHCQTNVDGVFALGDVNGHGAFTHTAVYDGEIVLDYLNGGPRKLSDRIPIYGLFTDPPLGRIGLTEKAAVEKGYQILKATMPMSQINRAKEMGETQGVAKFVVDAETDLILGGAIHGPGGDEIINMFAAVMQNNITYKKYREVMLVHPTVSELMPYVMDGLEEVS